MGEDAGKEKGGGGGSGFTIDWESWRMSVFLFVWHVCSWTLWTLMIRGSRGDEGTYQYDTVTVVLATELFKLLMSIVFHFSFIPYEKWSMEAHTIVSQYRISLYYGVPAVIYSVYNVLMYVNLSLFSPTNYRVLINIRVLWSGLLFQIFFNTRLGFHKWAGLFVLMLGCFVNQISWEFTLNSSLLALASIAFQAFLSSAGGVYSEMILKQNIEIPLVVKNIYLYFWSSVANILYIILTRPNLLIMENFFAGWTNLVVCLVFVGAICGFSTSVFLRYLNVLLKEFAHSAEMLLTAFLTAFLYGVPLTVSTLASIFLVAIAIYLYNQPNLVQNKPVLPVENPKKDESQSS